MQTVTVKSPFIQGDGLLLIDVQKDFCPGGALAVDGGDLIVPILNNWIEMAAERIIPIYASRDFGSQAWRWMFACWLPYWMPAMPVSKSL